MPRSIAVIYPSSPAAVHDLPDTPAQPAQLAQPPAAPAPNAIGVRVARARDRLAAAVRLPAALRLPADPVARRRRLSDAMFASGIATVGSSALMGMVPMMRQGISGDHESHGPEFALEWGASAALAMAGIAMSGAAFHMQGTANAMEMEQEVQAAIAAEGLTPTAPASPTAVAQAGQIEAGVASEASEASEESEASEMPETPLAAAPANHVPLAHDIENPPASAARSRAHADSQEG